MSRQGSELDEINSSQEVHRWDRQTSFERRDREIESVDQKQNELFNVQWRLIREQMGSMAKELAMCRQEVQALKGNDAKRDAMHTDYERRLRDNQDQIVAALEGESHKAFTQSEKNRKELNEMTRLLDEERSQRAGMKEDLEQLIRRVKLETESEAKHRNEKWQELISKVQENLDREVSDRKGLGESCQLNLREVRDIIRKEVSDRQLAAQEVAQVVTELKKAVDSERNERNLQDSSLRAQAGSNQRDSQQNKEEITALRLQMQTVESTIQPHIKDLRMIMEKESAERNTSHQRLERRCADLHLTLTEHGSARTLMGEEVDRGMKAHRQHVEQEREAGHAKLREVITEHGESQRYARDAQHHALQDLLQKEKAAREQQYEGLHAHVNRLCLTLFKVQACSETFL